MTLATAVGLVTLAGLSGGCGGSGGGSKSVGSSPTPTPSSSSTTPTPSPTPTPTPTSTPIPITLTVSPANTIVNAGDSVSFTATLSGTALNGVIWSVQEGSTGGSITANGAYTAPTTRGIYHVVALSQADNTKTGTAVVTVQSGNASIGVSSVRRATTKGEQTR